MLAEKIKEVELVTEEIVALRQAVQRLERRLVQETIAIPRARGTKNNINPWFVGDETDTARLRAAVEGALHSKAMTLAELAETTGARRNRISGVLVKLQRDGVNVVNLGDGYRAVWSIPSGKRAR